MCVCERGRAGVRRRGEGEELEVLDARDGDHTVVAVLRLFGVTGVRCGGRVDGDEVGDRARCEECTFESRWDWLRGRDTNAKTRERNRLAPGTMFTPSLTDKTHRAPIAPLSAASKGTMGVAIPG